MKATLESTDKIVELVVNGATVPARVWEGHTERGVPCIAFVTRIAAKKGADLTEFEQDLAEQKAPSAEALSFPTRMIL